MTKNFQVGSNIFPFPENGDVAPWGEEVTDWAEAVSDALATVQGPNDILSTSATLANNQAVAANVAGLTFNVSEVLEAKIEFYIKRVYDTGSTTVIESGQIFCDYDGSTFTISIRSNSDNDAGVVFSATNTGQIQYVSTDLANHVSSTVFFRAQTIDQ